MAGARSAGHGSNRSSLRTRAAGAPDDGEHADILRAGGTAPRGAARADQDARADRRGGRGRAPARGRREAQPQRTPTRARDRSSGRGAAVRARRLAPAARRGRRRASRARRRLARGRRRRRCEPAAPARRTGLVLGDGCACRGPRADACEPARTSRGARLRRGSRAPGAGGLGAAPGGRVALRRRRPGRWVGGERGSRTRTGVGPRRVPTGRCRSRHHAARCGSLPRARRRGAGTARATWPTATRVLSKSSRAPAQRTCSRPSRLRGRVDPEQSARVRASARGSRRRLAPRTRETRADGRCARRHATRASPILVAAAARRDRSAHVRAGAPGVRNAACCPRGRIASGGARRGYAGGVAASWPAPSSSSRRPPAPEARDRGEASAARGPCRLARVHTWASASIRHRAYIGARRRRGVLGGALADPAARSAVARVGTCACTTSTSKPRAGSSCGSRSARATAVQDVTCSPSSGADRAAWMPDELLDPQTSTPAACVRKRIAVASVVGIVADVAQIASRARCETNVLLASPAALGERRLRRGSRQVIQHEQLLGSRPANSSLGVSISAAPRRRGVGRPRSRPAFAHGCCGSSPRRTEDDHEPGRGAGQLGRVHPEASARSAEPLSRRGALELALFLLGGDRAFPGGSAAELRCSRRSRRRRRTSWRAATSLNFVLRS